MYGSERRRHIAEVLQASGRVTVADLASGLDVSPETIRRDLSLLETEGVLERTHGGAVPAVPGGRVEQTLAARRTENVTAKSAIARAALALLPAPGGSVLLDAGSTTACLAESLAEPLAEGNGLSLITNSVPVADALHRSGATPLHLLGGSVRGLTGACVGATVLRALDAIRVDIAFLGTNGLTVDRGLTTQDPDEAAVKSAMCDAARRVAVLADSSKFGHEFLISFADLDRIDVLVTDSPPTGALAGALHDRGIEVVLP
ncbi:MULTISPECIES: DeoR/GlpR family DNA-binding transcription regulator [unclassified Dietzia]|uniref:DeoR/GlpR family DNA-binding transcription regulator n=3 Tax=Dietzia TaxID=37914 RepID=UPI000D20B379|nr:MULTISPECIES: DeoR/GlpR family DNA-binding transcription regulator [unclassified Dietzia]AVZ40762.1 D-beta-D-heptose 1-phosphate adenosyltransferase [Dietzia sp. JS16-p6b]QGW26358.1 regulatory protein DeoR [Dietzia sp. DQ12-45-1b]